MISVLPVDLHNEYTYMPYTPGIKYIHYTSGLFSRVFCFLLSDTTKNVWSVSVQGLSLYVIKTGVLD